MSYSVKLQVSAVFPSRAEVAWRTLTEGDLTQVSQPWGPIPGVVAIRDEPPGFFSEPGLSRVFENSDGSTAVETIKGLDPPRRLEYSISRLTNSFRHLTPGADASFDFESISDVETRVTWRYSWHARNAAALPLLWLIGRLAFRQYMRRMLDRMSAATWTR